MVDNNSVLLQVGVKVLLQNDKGEYLLLKRSNKKYADIQDLWDIPGGRIIPGTDLIENLKRELKEETNLNLVGIPQLIYAQDIFPNQLHHIVRLTFIGKYSGEILLDNEEHQEYIWLDFKALINQENLDKYLKIAISEHFPKTKE